MSGVKSYGWQSPEILKRINSDPKIIDLLYDLGLLPEEISARVRHYVDEAVAAERERCAKLVEANIVIGTEGVNVTAEQMSMNSIWRFEAKKIRKGD